MRPYVVGLVFLAATGGRSGDPPDEPVADRVARLVKQLGHDRFAKREEASKGLDALGAPALDALRKAATANDPEIRRRAVRILLTISGRIRAAAAKELARWEGEWEGNGGQTFVIKGNRWWWGAGPFTPKDARMHPIKMIEVGDEATAADLLVEEGPMHVKVCRAIFRLDGDTLHYCGSYGPTRPTEFRANGANVYVLWKRAKPGAAAVAQAPPAPPPPADVQYVSDTFSLDLRLAESKPPVHRVVLQGRLADGGKATLTLDPNAPKFDKYGDLVAGGQRLPLVRLACTLKLAKAAKARQLWEIRGPKILSRLSLVTFSFGAPEGDGRLLVHDRNGEVRYVIQFIERMHRVPPCHPGCFPAGTQVLVPGGRTAIERVREGDLVTAIDAAGKPSPARVAGVFVTRNRVLEVRTEGGTLVTTATQPVGLVTGGFRAAGELKPGDRVWRWVDGRRRAAAVTAVTSAAREVLVFSLVLGEPTGFVAGGFVVRSKPPAAVARP